MSNNNSNIETLAEIRRISMWITPSKRSATRGIKTADYTRELCRSSTYNDFAQAVIPLEVYSIIENGMTLPKPLFSKAPLV